MRKYLPAQLILIALLLPAQQPAPSPGSPVPAQDMGKTLCKLEGRTVNSVTGEPVRKVDLRLMRREPGSNPASTTSDAEGRFLFENLEPGTYSFFAQRTGYLRQNYGATSPTASGTPLTLVPGQHLKDLEFKLIQQGVITGKVLDEEGEPMPRAFVNVMRQSSLGGRARTEGVSGDTANDVGEFRAANLSPGRYLVSANYSGGFFGPEAVRPKTDEPEQSYVPTFYPSSTDPAGAVAVEVGPGQEVAGINITLRKDRVYRVSGQVMGLAAGQDKNMYLTMAPRRRDPATMYFGGGAGGRVKPDGSFEILNVQPGSYTLTAMVRADARPQPAGRASVDVAGANVSGVVLNLSGAIQVTGVLRVEGEGPEKEKVSLSAIRVQLRPLDGVSYAGGMPPTVKEDGAFVIESVFPDRYSVSLFPMPESMYIKSLRLGTVDVIEKGLDLTNVSSIAAVEIVLSTKAATVEGFVREGDKPSPGKIIMLIPDPPRPEQPFLVKAGSSDQNGFYTIKGVAPGNYRLYAWAERPPYNIAEDSEALKPFESKAVKVSVEENSRKSQDLTVIKEK